MALVPPVFLDEPSNPSSSMYVRLSLPISLSALALDETFEYAFVVLCHHILVMAYTAMASIVMAYIVMAYIVMAAPS